MRRLAADGALRERLGQAARDWWTREHSIEVMVDDYERVMRDAAARPDPRASTCRRTCVTPAIAGSARCSIRSASR